ncbi:MAG: hypothetical protein KTR17_02495 [Cellvibrionaceae bacterium]|nr:hypothetical protein [Cellvibrionaceae bacterium]
MEIVAKDVLQLRGIQLKQCLGFGLPLARGVCHVPFQLKLLQKNGEVLNTRFQERGRWPDGSLRWLWCEAIVESDGFLDLAIEQELTSFEAVTSDPAGEAVVNLVHHTETEIFAKFNLPQFGSPLELSASLKLAKKDGVAGLQQLSIESTNTGYFDCVTVRGQFVWGKLRLNFSCRIKTCTLSQQSVLSVRIHNPEAALHPGGCWDLGDAGSVFIDSFDFSVHCQSAASQVAKVIDCAVGAIHQPGTEFKLVQTASGGEHWQSPIHIKADRTPAVTSNGFTLHHSEHALVSGDRAQPQLAFLADAGGCAIELLHFWQNFPAQLNVKQGVAHWGLFSEQTELQGGESKTWHFHLAGFTGQAEVPDLLAKKFSGEAVVSTDYIDQCACLPHLAFAQAPRELTPLINNGLEGAFPFSEKRERIDMYGWRNYGDLYADHETHGLAKEPYFVSVYNNQYDPLMGMTLQYLNSADSRWLDLFQSLNQHIQDIDIYDTKKDKAEYNGGLFWHTNHYLKMETSTHRSYSKYHSAVYENFSAGGGPGGQHCYSTGLMLQYRLFGDENAAAKVEQLCHWIRCFYNGSESLLDRSFRLLTVDIKASGMSNIGIKAPGFRYPLDRGIGNFLVALMDCYEVNNREALLKEAAYVIRNTCHPGEDLVQRELLDVENAWFYTVFLQAVARFILLKHSLTQYDADFFYAKACLMHFAAWMLEHEVFYLDRPEVLEFPNDTWCAQDIRKATIYNCAAMLSADTTESQRYAAARDKTIHYVAEKLRDSQERHYTRILVLLMQSVFTLRLPHKLPESAVSSSNQNFGIVPRHSMLGILKAYISDMLKLLTKFSLSREVRWFKLRFLKR